MFNRNTMATKESVSRNTEIIMDYLWQPLWLWGHSLRGHKSSQRFLPPLEQPQQRTLPPVSATVKHSSHFLCRTWAYIIGPGKYHLNNWTVDNSLEQWMRGCRGETAVQTPCLTAHYTSITTKWASLPLYFQTLVGPIAQLGQPPAKADVPTSSLSSSLKRQAIHYDPSLLGVYSVPIYHRCMEGMCSVSCTEGSIPQDIKRKWEDLFSSEEAALDTDTVQQTVSFESII